MDLSSSFPTFGPSLSKLQTELGYFAWSDCMCGGHVGSFTSTGVETGHFGANGGVLGLFNKSYNHCYVFFIRLYGIWSYFC